MLVPRYLLRRTRLVQETTGIKRLRVCTPQSGRCVHSVDRNRHELTLRNKYLIDEGT